MLIHCNHKSTRAFSIRMPKDKGTSSVAKYKCILEHMYPSFLFHRPVMKNANNIVAIFRTTKIESCVIERGKG